MNQVEEKGDGNELDDLSEDIFQNLALAIQVADDFLSGYNLMDQSLLTQE